MIFFFCWSIILFYQQKRTQAEAYLFYGICMTGKFYPGSLLNCKFTLAILYYYVNQNEEL